MQKDTRVAFIEVSKERPTSLLLLTVAAWIGLIASLYWLVRTILKLQADKRPLAIIGRMLSPATALLLAVSFLVTEDLAVRTPLIFLAAVLGLLGTILQNRFPSR